MFNIYYVCIFGWSSEASEILLDRNNETKFRLCVRKCVTVTATERL